MVRRCVWSRNLQNEKAMTRVGSQRHSKKKKKSHCSQLHAWPESSHKKINNSRCVGKRWERKDTNIHQGILFPKGTAEGREHLSQHSFKPTTPYKIQNSKNIPSAFKSQVLPPLIICPYIRTSRNPEYEFTIIVIFFYSKPAVKPSGADKTKLKIKDSLLQT